jgi:hypothetical protein
MPAMKPKVRADLAVVEIDGEAVIYDEPSRDVLYLNPTATIVFGLCDGTGTVKEMAADIADAFSVPTDQVERQVRSLLREFKKSRLLDGYGPPEHVHTKKSEITPQIEIGHKDEAQHDHADDEEDDHDERERIRAEKPANP